MTAQTGTGNRRLLLVVALTALVGLSACGQTAARTHAGSLGDVPVGTGSSPEPGTNGQPQVQPHGHGDSIIAVGNVAYVGSDNERIYAFRSTDGHILWQRSLGGAVYVYAVTGGAVYALADAEGVGSGGPASSSTTTLYALNAGSGATLWKFSAPGPNQPTNVVVGDGIVYVGTSSEGQQQTILALDGSDGRLLWQYTQSTGIPGPIAAGSGVVYISQVAAPNVSLATTTFSALDASSGKLRWSLSIPTADGPVGGPPAMGDGMLYVETTFGSVYALQASTGEEVWHVSAAEVPGVPPQPLNSRLSPILESGVLFAGGPAGVAAYQASNGSVLWQYSKSLAGPFPPQIVLQSGDLYVASMGLLAALDASTGSVLWQKQNQPGLGLIPNAPLIVTGGVVITGASALRASDGSQLWQSSVSPGGEGNVNAGTQEAVAAGVVYIGTDDGVVHALNAGSGSSLWSYTIPELRVPVSPVYNANVTFSQTTTYQQALQILTNLGLQTSLVCTAQWTDSDTSSTTFPKSHSLYVQATVASAPLWLIRLQATPGVASAQGVSGFFSCPAEPEPTGPRYLSSQQADSYVQVTFTGATATTYSTVLEAVDGQGFRLADPCYEQSRAAGLKPTWPPMSQAASFAKTGRLVLATTTENATTWLEQLRALPGVTQATSPYTTSC